MLRWTFASFSRVIPGPLGARPCARRTCPYEEDTSPVALRAALHDCLATRGCAVLIGRNTGPVPHCAATADLRSRAYAQCARRPDHVGLFQIAMALRSAQCDSALPAS